MQFKTVSAYFFILDVRRQKKFLYAEKYVLSLKIKAYSAIIYEKNIYENGT